LSTFRTAGLPSNTELHVAFDRASVQFELASASQNVATTANCLAQGRFAGITETRGRITDTTDITLPGYPRVNCDFLGTQNGTLALRVADYVSQRGAGDAELNGHSFRIRSVNQTQNSGFPIARLGYEILADGKVLAAALLQYTSMLGAQEL